MSAAVRVKIISISSVVVKLIDKAQCKRTKYLDSQGLEKISSID